MMIKDRNLRMNGKLKSSIMREQTFRGGPGAEADVPGGPGEGANVPGST